MRVARVEAAGDAAAGLVEHDVLGLDRPLTGQRRDLLAALVSGIRLRHAQVVPVGVGLHSYPVD
jgi:hypothetical protein